MANISHTMEVKGTNKESLNEAGNLGIVMGVVGVGSGGNKGSSEVLEHR
jgi:hypothetical protein